MAALRVTITGATGLIGRHLTAELRRRGAQVTVLSRDPPRAQQALSATADSSVRVLPWEPLRGLAPAPALAGRDAVVHLAGESIAQRWSARAMRAIRDSRVVGTGNLVEALRGAEPCPRALLSASAVGYYGARGEEPIDEDAPPGSDFLAAVCTAWETQAERARELGMRVAQFRNGVVLDAHGGALGAMLTPFRLGLGGPVAGGRQYISWIHRDDLVAMILAALEDERWSGPVNGTAPEPVSNREFATALGAALHRPARLPVPGILLRARYGQLAQTLTTGARVLPAKPLVLGYRFRYPQVRGALAAALSGRS